jgi:AcrR family transcriptional regulator
MVSTQLVSPWANERASRDEIEGQKREAVLRAAAIAFVEYGFHGATMDKIAELLDVSKPTVYKHYKNKDDLLHACLDRALGRFTDVSIEARELDGSAIDKIKHYLYKSVEFNVDEFGKVLVRVERSGADPTLREMRRERWDEITDTFRDIVRDGIEKNEINSNVDPKMVMLALFGAFNFIPVWYDPDGDYSATEICDQFFEVFISGLKP